jgi:hypothetical protein
MLSVDPESSSLPQKYTAPESSTNRAVRACYQAAVCLDVTVLALTGVVRELELESDGSESTTEKEFLGEIARLLDPLNELVIDATRTYERLRRGGDHSLAPF